MNYTKGEWKIGKPYISRRKEHIPIIVRSENVIHTICETTPLQYGVTDEDKANAKLIAAAPNLLNALISCKQLIEKLQDDDIIKNWTGEVEMNLAIEKATT